MANGTPTMAAQRRRVLVTSALLAAAHAFLVFSEVDLRFVAASAVLVVLTGVGLALYAQRRQAHARAEVERVITAGLLPNALWAGYVGEGPVPGEAHVRGASARRPAATGVLAVLPDSLRFFPSVAAERHGHTAWSVPISEVTGADRRPAPFAAWLYVAFGGTRRSFGAIGESEGFLTAMRSLGVPLG